MAKTYEYNDQTGTYYEIEDYKDGVIIRTMQDVQPVLDHVQRRRNSGYNDRGIKQDWWCYASIPAAVWLKWKAEKGIDVFNRDHEKDVFRLINSEYPHLKHTHLQHTPGFRHT